MSDQEKEIEEIARAIARDYGLDPDDARLGWPAWRTDWILEEARKRAGSGASRTKHDG
jgi:hypothetical protein